MTRLMVSLPEPICLTADVRDPVVDASMEGLQAGAERRSYPSLSPITIQSVGLSLILIVWHAYFHPTIAWRFSSLDASPALTLTIRFSLPQLTTSTSTQALSSSSLNITIYGPRSTYGGLTTETQKFAWGLALPISTSSAPILPAQIGITKSLSSEHSKKVEHAFTITGTPPPPPPPLHHTSVVWTIEENSSSKLGTPSKIQFAILFVDNHHHSALLLQVSCNLTAKTNGAEFGLYSGPHWLIAKSDDKNENEIIDPKRYVGLLKVFDFEPGVEPVEGLREGWMDGGGGRCCQGNWAGVF